MSNHHAINDTDEEHQMTRTDSGARGRPYGLPRRRRLRAAALGALAAVGLLAGAATAHAEPADPEKFGLEIFETGRDGTSNAGGHPSVWTKIRFKTGEGTAPISPRPHGTPQRIEVEMPFGLVGNPSATPRCTRPQFYARACPPQSQVGVASPIIPQFAAFITGNRAIYNMVPDGDSPALFGIDVLGIVQNYAFLRIKVRPDGGLIAVTDPISRSLPLIENTLRFWGVPADENRCNPNHPLYNPLAPNPYLFAGGLCPLTNPADWERRPFITSPTDCENVPTSRVRVYSYEGRMDSATASQPHAPEHCEGMTFEPHVVVSSESRTAGAPSAVSVDILVPQNDDPDGQATPRLRNVTMVMPEGLSINAGVARDLSLCSDGQFGKEADRAANCPRGSKIGTLGITTPLLPNPMPGDIYLGESKPGERFRLFLYAEGAGNVRVKIAGVVQPDPQTGRVVAVFKDNPPLPFSRLHLRFRGGNNAVLALPSTCGTKTGFAALQGYSGQVKQIGTAIQVYGDDQGSPCPEKQPFNPSFVAGTTSADAGQDTGLTLSFGRGDQDEYLGGLKMQLPHGLLGRLASVPQCPVAQADSGGCSNDSLVGNVTVAAGAGDALLHLPGKVYLTEAQKPGQIAGMAIVVPALAGPYDLGTVVVKTGIKVNPDTSLTVETDPMPTMLEGINLRLRQVTVNIDRPGFMFNPTDCSAKQIAATLVSSTGTESAVGNHFQVTGCDALPFAPPMTVGTAKPSKVGGPIGLRVNLGGIGGHANARQVQVVLPAGIGARLEGAVQNQCTQQQFAADECPAASRVGTATAKTPILPVPLEGSVFFLDNGKGGGLPKLAVRLKGPVQLDLVADVELTPGGRIVNTFPAVPDVPLSNFELVLEGGSNAALSAADVCSGPLYAERNMIAHSGKTVGDRVKVDVLGCTNSAASKAKAKRVKGASRKAKAGKRSAGRGKRA